MLESETPEKIAELWKQYHTKKYCVYSSIPSKTYTSLNVRLQQNPMFILPRIISPILSIVTTKFHLELNSLTVFFCIILLWNWCTTTVPREQRIEFVFMQVQGDVVLFTLLQEYKEKGIHSKPLLIIKHYTELMHSKEVTNSNKKPSFNDHFQKIQTKFNYRTNLCQQRILTCHFFNFELSVGIDARWNRSRESYTLRSSGPIALPLTSHFHSPFTFLWIFICYVLFWFFSTSCEVWQSLMRDIKLQLLVNQLQMHYLDDKRYRNVETFNKNPQRFDFNTLLEHIPIPQKDTNPSNTTTPPSSNNTNKPK